MSDTDVVKSYSSAFRLGLHMDNIEDNYVFEGRMFSAYVVSGAIASLGTYDLGILTGSSIATYIPAAVTTSSDSVTISVQEGAVATGGTPVVTTNRNRQSTVSSKVTLMATPTVSNAGTLVSSSFIGGVAGNPQSRQGGTASGGNKMVLKPNTQYLLRLTNGSTVANTIRVKMEWIESV